MIQYKKSLIFLFLNFELLVFISLKNPFLLHKGGIVFGEDLNEHLHRAKELSLLPHKANRHPIR